VNGSHPPAALTIRALRAGSAFAITLLLAGAALHAVGSDVADRAALLGVLAMIATPVIGLAATVAESWSRNRTIALLALAVIAVLVVAVAIALFIGRRAEEPGKASTARGGGPGRAISMR
jgi:hypothetical protein